LTKKVQVERAIY